MSNVPDKFYQVCRLCMAVVCDSDIPELSMYDISKTRSVANNQQQINNTVIISNTSKSDDANALNHKNDSVHKLVADSKETIDCNASGLLNDGNGDGVEDDDDESRIDLHERIYTFLAITVSQSTIFFLYSCDYLSDNFYSLSNEIFPKMIR